MPISYLPDATLRAITSTLVLNDATSVVKELVDNALDAKASTIAIDISANTLDVIQVKDNGTGIGVEDRQLVCKRGCTSKITTTEDLEHLGGSTLGFRGEALASIAALSDSVTLTTRVDGETAGSMLNYGPTEALLSRSSASHPVGSTIRVKDFLMSIPVRKQTALKNASKTLFAIQTLLQSYAFARGTVRFSLKVLKGKNDKANWQYNPVATLNDLKGVAIRVIGKDVAGLCEVCSHTTSSGSEGDGISEDYCVVALLATINENSSKLSNTGHYMSIDGRPVTASRGIFKEIVKLYRHYTRSSAASIAGLPASFDPLLAMHITCPSASYDVNMEPAKDEVMFIDPQRVISLVESLFKDYYGEQSQLKPVRQTIEKVKSGAIAGSSFDVLLAKRPTPSNEPGSMPKHSIQTTTASQHARTFPMLYSTTSRSSSGQSLPQGGSIAPEICSPERAEALQNAATKALSNMYGRDDDDEEPPPVSPRPCDLDLDIQEAENELAKNPWSIARVNAPIRRSSRSDQSSSSANDKSPPNNLAQDSPQLQVTLQSSTHRQQLGLPTQFPSPVTSPHSPGVFQNPGPPNRPWASRQRREASYEPEPDTLQTEASEITRKSLDSWAKPLKSRTELPSFQRVSEIYDKDRRLDQEPRDKSAGMSAVRGLSDGLDKPLVASSPASGEPIRQPALKMSQSQNPVLDQIMEFEHRKKAANLQHRGEFRKVHGRGLHVAQLAQLQRSTIVATADTTGFEQTQSTQNDVRDIERPSAVAAFGDRFSEANAISQTSHKNNPHRNRYLAAAKALTRSQPSDIDASLDSEVPRFEGARIIEDRGSISEMVEEDPRAYLMRQRFHTDGAKASGLTKTGSKIRRTKTQRLPFESVPVDMMLHDLVSQIDFELQACAQSGPLVDKYNVSGKNSFIEWSPSMANIPQWQEGLTMLVDKVYRAQMDEELISPNIEIDLRRMIKTHCDNI